MVQSTKNNKDILGEDFSLEDLEYISEISRIAESNRKYFDLEFEETKPKESNDLGGKLLLSDTDSEDPRRGEKSRKGDLDLSSFDGRENQKEESGDEDIAHEENMSSFQDELDKENYLGSEDISDSVPDVIGDDYDFSDVEFLKTNDGARQEKISEFELDFIGEEEFDEYEELPLREELSFVVQTEGRVSLEHRVHQIALEISESVGWDKAGVTMLVEILSSSRGNKTRQSIEQAIRAGYDSKEIFLAHQLRLSWLEHSEFAVSFRGHDYLYLSWPLALKAVRLFEGYPDLSELECFLEEIYQHWWMREELRHRYPAFQYYLQVRVSGFLNSYLASPSLLLGDCFLDDDYDSGRFQGFNVPLQRDLDLYGLIPNILNDKIVEAVAILELHPDVKRQFSENE